LRTPAIWRRVMSCFSKPAMALDQLPRPRTRDSAWRRAFTGSRHLRLKEVGRALLS
jgi:hypothetical protein